VAFFSKIKAWNQSFLDMFNQSLQFDDNLSPITPQHLEAQYLKKKKLRKKTRNS
jgi:hypothetical protein